MEIFHVTIVMRRARNEDAQTICTLIGTCWGETPATTTVQRALRTGSHRCDLLEVDGEVVGLVSGFMTHDIDGRARWELDLLCVVPRMRGRGYAKNLVQASVEHGGSLGAEYCRVLVATENMKANYVFLRTGFIAAPFDAMLCVLRREQLHNRELPITQDCTRGALVVNTLSYSGVWVDDAVFKDCAEPARRLAASYNLDLVGVVAAVQGQSRGLAEELGYAVIGAYRWWTIKLDAG
jgi:ribosomal protein S18 acetylase RimI-like enzyme